MVFRFEDFVLDVDRRELRRANTLIAIQPQVFDVIEYLVRERERVITKDDLLDEVWNGRVVSESTLTSRINAARRALGDSGQAQRLIRTVQKRGFRFVGTVVSDAPISLVRPTGTRPLASGLASPDLADVDRTPPRKPSIAVLPFDVLNVEEDRRILADGLVQDIMTRLGRARWLFVIARGTMFALRGEMRDAQQIASALGVRYVLQGCLQWSGNKIRLNVALVDGIDRTEIWAEYFDRAVDDIFAIQDEIADNIVGRVQSEVEQTERQRALLKPLASLDAWEAYHRASWHVDRHTTEDYAQAETCFKVAARLDPRSARVFAGLSYVHRQRAFLDLTSDREGEVQQTFEFAQHSLSLDAHDPQAHWAAGRALMLRYEVEAALEQFETAAALNPSFALGQYSVGLSQAISGRSAPSDEALVRARRLSPLDPIQFAMLATRAFNAATSGEHERAADLAQRAAGHPNAHHHIVAIAALCNGLAGRKAGAEKYLKRLREQHPGYHSDDYFRAFPFRSADHVALFRKGFGLLGLA